VQHLLPPGAPPPVTKESLARYSHPPETAKSWTPREVLLPRGDRLSRGEMSLCLLLMSRRDGPAAGGLWYPRCHYTDKFQKLQYASSYRWLSALLKNMDKINVIIILLSNR
jgi:hypothetical protein